MISGLTKESGVGDDQSALVHSLGGEDVVAWEFSSTMAMVRLGFGVDGRPQRSSL